MASPVRPLASLHARSPASGAKYQPSQIICPIQRAKKSRISQGRQLFGSFILPEKKKLK
jgi:hypothetical protein